MSTSPSYRDRKSIRHLDGTTIFKNGEDERNEREVAKLIESAWKCNLHSWGTLTPVDWWAERDGRIVGYLELKARCHESNKYPTVFLNLRKWLSLLLLQQTGHPSFFVVRFLDGVYWISINQVDPLKVKIGGCKRIVESRNDVEPMIEIPISSMKKLSV